METGRQWLEEIKQYNFDEERRVSLEEQQAAREMRDIQVRVILIMMIMDGDDGDGEVWERQVKSVTVLLKNCNIWSTLGTCQLSGKRYEGNPRDK